MGDSAENRGTQAKHWKIYPPASQDFVRATHEHPLLMQILHNRGLHEPESALEFLAQDDAVLENPFRLPDMPAAASRLVRAIEMGETVCVYGDFDADGVAATALLVTALQAAGGKVGPYIPDRVDEGYGLNLEALDTIARKAQLLVTVDCGIRSVDEVGYACRLGLDVIITDHHTIGPVLPPALAVVNPRRRDVASTFNRLAGVGVAYRLAQAVLRLCAQQRIGGVDVDKAALLEQELLDLVALGTVADMMPLVGENRSLVRRGLAQLNLAMRPGLAALMTQADLRPGAVDTTGISFRLGPRINAAGRLAHAELAYRLLRTSDPTDAYLFATELETLNVRRRSLTEQAEIEAETQLAEQTQAGAPLLFVRSPNMQPGIVGLVAGKLAERYYRPAVVVEQGPEECRGSARSIAEFDISVALDQLSHHLVRHGGHSRAAGFTVATQDLPLLEKELNCLASAALGGRDDLRPTLWIDVEARLGDLNWGLRDQFARLEPTGYGNPAPLLWSRNARVRDLRPVGSGRHLKLILDSGPQTSVVDAIAFGQGKWADLIQPNDHVDAVYHLEINEWNGRQSLQLNIQDMRPAGSGPDPQVAEPLPD